MRPWLRSWNARANTSGVILRLELPRRRKYPPGLPCTNKLRGTSMRSTTASPPSAVASSCFSRSASKAGLMESLQISTTQRSTASRSSSGMPSTWRVPSSTPNTNVPPRPLAKAASSSARPSRCGERTRAPLMRTLLSSKVESSPRRMRRASAAPRASTASPAVASSTTVRGPCKNNRRKHLPRPAESKRLTTPTLHTTPCLSKASLG